MIKLRVSVCIVLSPPSFVLSHPALLDIIENQKPIGGSDWDAVESRYHEVCESSGWQLRPEGAIKRKYFALANVRKPTGVLYMSSSSSST